jgi:hypothetical protein
VSLIPTTAGSRRSSLSVRDTRSPGSAASDLPSIHIRNELRWPKLTSSARTTVPCILPKRIKVVRLQRSFQSKSRVLGWAFAIRSHCSHTPLRLQCDLILHPSGTAPSNAHQGRTPGRCGRLERHPISIRLEPEGITPHANVKPGAGSRGVAAAKETCLGTN